MSDCTITVYSDKFAWTEYTSKTVSSGSSPTLKFRATAGMVFNKLLDNGVQQIPVGDTYTISNISGNHTIEVFTKVTDTCIIIPNFNFYKISPLQYYIMDTSVFGTSAHTWTWRVNRDVTHARNFVYTFPSAGSYHVELWLRSDLSQSQIESYVTIS